MRFDLLYVQILCPGLLILAAYFGGKLSRCLHIGEVVGQVLAAGHRPRFAFLPLAEMLASKRSILRIFH